MNINYMLLDLNLTCKKKDYNILLPTTTPICNQNIWLWLWNLVLFLLILLNLLSKIIKLPIASTKRSTRATFKLLNFSLVLPRVRFYTALLVSIVGSYFAQGALSHVECMRIYSLRPNPLVESPIGCHYIGLYIAFRYHFLRRVTKLVVYNS